MRVTRVSMAGRAGMRLMATSAYVLKVRRVTVFVYVHNVCIAVAFSSVALFQ